MKLVDAIKSRKRKLLKTAIGSESLYADFRRLSSNPIPNTAAMSPKAGTTIAPNSGTTVVPETTNIDAVAIFPAGSFTSITTLKVPGEA